MAPSVAPPVHCDQLHPTLRVRDLEAAIAYYVDKLGFQLGFRYGDPPSTAGVNIGSVQVHLKAGTPAPTGTEVYFVIDDVDQLYELHRRNGVIVDAPPTDQEWGLRDYRAYDLDGYRLGFGQHLPLNGPKIEIEREELTIRIERRLAGVLRDLAGEKNRTLGQILEEIVLHTFEPVSSGGVASPYTKSTFTRIEALKKVHGVDYDAHACYRFVEKA